MKNAIGLSFLFYIASFFSLNLFAQSLCSQVFADPLKGLELQDASSGRVLVANRFFGYRDDPFLQSVIDNVQPVLQGFIIPQNVKIAIREMSGEGILPIPVLGAHFSPTYRTTFVNPRMYDVSTVEGIRHFKTVFQHEFGHYLFFENMIRHSEAWGKWWNQLSNPVRAELNGLFPMLNSGPHTMVDISSPYQELFADLVPVIASRDPSLFVKFSEYFEIKSENPETRNFEAPFFRTRWNEAEEHAMLAPARSYIWENYLHNGKNEGREAALLNDIFDILAREILIRNDDPSLHELAPEVINHRLLTAFNEGLGHYR